jgi:glutathione synthase/RimK-type ligase-like ATP-grasp enzyme
MNIAFLYKSAKNEPIVRRLAEQMVAYGGNVSAVHESSANLLEHLEDTVIIRWDSKVDVPGTVSLNDPGPVALSRDKIASRKVLGELAPKTYFPETYYSRIPLPVIARPRRHSGGRHFHLIETPEQMRRLTRRYLSKGWYASPIVAKLEEFRVFVVCGRIAAVSQHFPPAEAPEQIAWNVSAGGRMKNVRWDSWQITVLKRSIEATERLGLDFAAVDIATVADSEPVVFELNTAPGVTNRYTKECVAKALLWSAEKRIAPGIGDTWKTYVHPSIRDFEQPGL